MDIKGFYSRNYGKLFVVPLAIFIFCLVVIGMHYARTGEILDKDVSLKGGLTITIYTPQQDPELESYLKAKLPLGDISVRQLSEFGTNTQLGLLIDAAEVQEEDIKAALEERLKLTLTAENYSVESVGSSLGEAFYKQMRTAIILAFLFIAIVVLITFRTIVPSFTVVFCAFCDMLFPVAIMDLIGMKLSTAGIAALLMLIGYSIDTDILITTKALKRREEGNVIDRMSSGVMTGLTMTGTTLVALTTGYFVSQSPVIKEMFFILILGLSYDMVITYLMNAGILVWWAKRKALN